MTTMVTRQRTAHEIIIDRIEAKYSSRLKRATINNIMYLHKQIDDELDAAYDEYHLLLPKKDEHGHLTPVPSSEEVDIALDLVLEQHEVSR